jgi:exonuclease SbcD
MRIAQMSDLHYADKTLAEVDRCFDFAVDQAIARRVDAVVISGDSTDHELPGSATRPPLIVFNPNWRRRHDQDSQETNSTPPGAAASTSALCGHVGAG